MTSRDFSLTLSKKFADLVVKAARAAPEMSI